MSKSRIHSVQWPEAIKALESASASVYKSVCYVFIYLFFYYNLLDFKARLEKFHPPTSLTSL